MPAPTILKRSLEFHFPRSVSVAKQIPQTLEVIITPLSDPSAPDQGTYVGGLQKQSVLLDDDDNVLLFRLVPTASPDLLAPVTYRAAWREGGVIGRTFTYDFAMPDADIRFDELAELGQIIGGETYLQQTDLGVPGRVAKLNDDGVPVDSDGHPAAGAAATAGRRWTGRAARRGQGAARRGEGQRRAGGFPGRAAGRAQNGGAGGEGRQNGCC